MTPKEILDLPMGSNDADAATIRDYFKALLVEVWTQGESFSGKRPFGNGGWHEEVERILIMNGLCPGKLGEYNEVEEINIVVAKELVLAAIAAL